MTTRTSEIAARVEKAYLQPILFGGQYVNFEAARQDVEFLLKELATAKEDLERMRSLLNTPELIDFAKAIQIEAAHQREKWGPKHDAQKLPNDWVAVVTHLLGKAIKAQWEDDAEKYLHHIITVAAVCNNWHAAALKGGAV